MSTVAEIQHAILELPEAERQDVAHWVFEQRLAEPGRRYTDDGLDIEETQRKLDEAASGRFFAVDPEEQIRKIMASLG